MTVYKSEFKVTDELTDVEDGGAAVIINSPKGELVGDGCMFVRIQSWDDTKSHPAMQRLRGKTIRVTVEVLD